MSAEMINKINNIINHNTILRTVFLSVDLVVFSLRQHYTYIYKYILYANHAHCSYIRFNKRLNITLPNGKQILYILI